MLPEDILRLLFAGTARQLKWRRTKYVGRTQPPTVLFPHVLPVDLMGGVLELTLPLAGAAGEECFRLRKYLPDGTLHSLYPMYWLCSKTTMNEEWTQTHGSVLFYHDNRVLSNCFRTDTANDPPLFYQLPVSS